jgi:diguanylate cyclase (GGDEF)-like protein/PAS domain S-box-containing protein
MATACPNEDFLTRSCQLCGAWKHSHSAMALLDPHGKVLQCNPACAALFGSDAYTAVGKGLVDCLFHDSDSPDYQAMHEAIKHCALGHQVEYDLERSADPLRVTMEPICAKNGLVSMLLVHTHSIREHVLIREALERRAHYDALTGLPNRILFTDRLQQSLARARRECRMAAICYLDLDGFKAVNDQMGHAAGDQLLVEIASRLLDAVRGGDTVARVGGDEFILILGNIESQREIDVAMERVIETVAQPVTADAQQALVTVSIGIALFPQHSEDADILVRFADMAMYVAKQSGKNQVSYHDPDLARVNIRHFELLQSIKKGFDAGRQNRWRQGPATLASPAAWPATPSRVP